MERACYRVEHQFEVPAWDEAMAQKAMNYWAGRHFIFHLTTPQTLVGKRGSWWGNLISYDMSRLLATLSIHVVGERTLRCALDVNTQFQMVTQYNQAFWQLELETFESLLLHDDWQPEKWEKFHRHNSKHMWLWTLSLGILGRTIPPEERPQPKRPFIRAPLSSILSPMSSPEKVLSSEQIYDGKVVNLRVDTIELPSGNVTKREIMEHGGAVCIIPMLPDGKIGMIKQWRSAVQEYLWELPAGGLEPGEDPEACAGRELVEEIGYQAGKLTLIFQCYLAPGYSSEMMWGFLGEELKEVGAQPEEDENIDLVPMSLEEALPLIDSGEIRDSKTVCGLLALYRRQLEAGS